MKKKKKKKRTNSAGSAAGDGKEKEGRQEEEGQNRRQEVQKHKNVREHPATPTNKSGTTLTPIKEPKDSKLSLEKVSGVIAETKVVTAKTLDKTLRRATPKLLTSECSSPTPRRLPNCPRPPPACMRRNLLAFVTKSPRLKTRAMTLRLPANNNPAPQRKRHHGYKFAGESQNRKSIAIHIAQHI